MKVYSTFDEFLDRYLEDFVEINRYETMEFQEYNFGLLFEYGNIVNQLPFDNDELEKEGKYIEKKYGIFQLINIMKEFEFEDREPSNKNTQKISKILKKEAYKISSYLKNEILKDEIAQAKTEGRTFDKLNSALQYPETIQKYANAFFKGDLRKIELLRFFSENLTTTSKKFTELTKYNQIYFYFNEQAKTNLEKTAYKELVRILFNFNYGNREIKGSTQKHLEQLENLHNQFLETKN